MVKRVSETDLGFSGWRLQNRVEFLPGLPCGFQDGMAGVGPRLNAWRLLSTLLHCSV